MALTAPQVLNKLKKMGTAQNRKVYARHGFGPDMFGVSYANLNALAKQIKVDHALAAALWDSGNHDARVLAMKVADPQAVTAAQVDKWVREADNTAVTDGVAGVVAVSRFADTRRDKWSRARDEWVARAGWNLVSSYARLDTDAPNRVFEAYLKRIESEVGAAKNRTREAMNYALINIGVRNDALHKKAVATSKRLGQIEVDHGETGCKTPVPIDYMKKTIAYNRKKAAKKSSRRKTA